ncbi:MAG: nicotinic acid mononucleotide adenylyltransferase, partial [Bacteroidetes bacterium RIFCSPLOWO2_12_FULL_31_6]
NIGLYFGTFNPIHVGHLIIANHMVDYTSLDQVWLVVTPQNPLKNKTSLLADYHRLATVRISVEDNTRLKACNIEFDLPKPSYTVNTLVYLKEKYPEHTFSLIMGEDNLRTFHKWKNYQQILENYSIYIYPRLLTEQEKEEDQNITSNNLLRSHPNVTIYNAPVMTVSASFIREAIKNKKDVHYLLTDPVYKYVTEMHFYEK